jgi:hypothetical protein
VKYRPTGAATSSSGSSSVLIVMARRQAARIEQQLARFSLEPPHHGASHHAMLTGHPDGLIGQIEDSLLAFRHSSLPVSVAL